MPTKPIERLLFAQGQLCFFCRQPLSPADASVEHLVATANGGGNGDDNIVACCKTLNALLGRQSLKEKLRVILNQKGEFKCPKGAGNRRAVIALPQGAVESLSTQDLTALVDTLKARGIIAVSGTKVSYNLVTTSKNRESAAHSPE